MTGISGKREKELMKEPKDLLDRIAKFDVFPGARALRLSFKDAVEKYISVKYGNRVGKGLSRAHIYSEDKKLYAAINNYEKEWDLPFDIPSVRTLARERFERVASIGLDRAPRRDRDAAHRIAKREAKRLANG